MAIDGRVEAGGPPCLTSLRSHIGSGDLPRAHVLAAVLHVASGVSVLVLTPVSGLIERQIEVAAVAVLAIVAGGSICALPWDRWSDNASRWLIPEALSLVALFNIAANQAHLHPLFYVVVWIWVGLTQHPGSSLRWAPVLAVAYAVPTLVSGDRVALLSGLLAVPIFVVLGETTAAVTSRMQTNQLAVAASEARYSALIQASHEFVLIVGADRRVVFANKALERMLGWTIDDLGDGFSARLIHKDDRPQVSSWYDDSIDGGSVTDMAELRMLHRDGSWRWIEATVTNMLDDSDVRGIVVNGRDISERTLAERRLEHAANTDSLTGLANRKALLAMLDGALADKQGNVALLFIDLDDFKRINDSLGHAIGDQLLCAVSRRMDTFASEVGRLCRIGGDEFVVAIPDASAVDPDELAAAVVAVVNGPFKIGAHELRIAASVGVADSAGIGTSAELLGRGDLAMYKAKSNGGRQWARYDEELARHARNRHELEEDLRIAIAGGQLFVEFQPSVELATEGVVGAEALVRWNHPERGRVGPDEFIGVAEQSGLIVELGAWVLDQALRARSAWASDGHDMRVSVNVSPRQLQGMTFVANVAAALQRHNVAPEHLQLEITEGTLLEDDVAGVVLPALRDLGVRLAIDDFGTGYSSLAYLDRLDVQTLKIDKSFLSRVGSRSGAPLVAAIIAMAHSLGLVVVAEGAEVSSQVDLLRSLGCDEVQGYVYSRPVSSAQFAAWLADREPMTAPKLRSIATG